MPARVATAGPAYTFLETELQRTKGDSILSIGAVREAVTEVVAFMLFAMGQRFAQRARNACPIVDPCTDGLLGSNQSHCA